MKNFDFRGGRPSRIGDDDDEFLEIDISKFSILLEDVNGGHPLDEIFNISKGALFIHDRIAYALAQSFIDISLLNLKLSIDKKIVYEIYKNNNGYFLFKLMTLPTELELAALSQFIMERFTFKDMVIVDSLGLASFIPDRFEESYDPRILKTKETVLNNQIDAFDAPLLEVGNIILGLTASLICAAELRHIPASALICIREAAYQVSEAKKIEKYWGKLSNYLGVNLELPTQDTYLALRKSDPFLYTTEILYT